MAVSGRDPGSTVAARSFTRARRFGQRAVHPVYPRRCPKPDTRNVLGFTGAGGGGASRRPRARYRDGGLRHITPPGVAVRQPRAFMGARIKELLAQGKVVRVFMLGQLCSPKLVEMVGLHGGWDAVWFDLEHVGLTTADVEECARAARVTGLDSFVRLAATDYATVMRPLEAGAGGVMAAQVRSAEETKNVVTWAKFHPLGL